MPVTIVHVYVDSRFIQEFIEATRENHKHSIQENGNLRFDILQDALEPSKFVLYEAYDSDTAVAAHKETSHYAKWRDTGAPWMVKPREGVKHKLLFPEKESK